MSIHALGFELVRALEEHLSAEKEFQGKYSHAITALLLWSTVKADCPDIMTKFERHVNMVDKFAKKLVKLSFDPTAYWSGNQEFRSSMLYFMTHKAYLRIHSDWLQIRKQDKELFQRYCVFRIYMFIASL